MKKKILNLFYEEVVPQASKGEVKIGDWLFHIGFSTKIEGKPLSNEDTNKLHLNIKNVQKFQELLVSYTEKMLLFLNSYPDFKNIDSLYFDGNIDNIIKNVLAFLFVNASSLDLENPESFLMRQISFFDMELLVDKYSSVSSSTISSLNESKVAFSIVPQNPCTGESLYKLESKITNTLENYTLPSISFGICENTCYVYGIQKRKENFTQYEKKINRLLYKVNKDVEEDYEEERIQDISSSQIVALTCFLKFLRMEEIEKIVVVPYLPLRYQAKEKIIDKKVLKANIDERNELKETLENKTDFIQQNITNKFLRVFARLCYHFPEVRTISYPFELDDKLHLEIGKEMKYNNDHLLYQIYDSFNTLKEKGSK